VTTASSRTRFVWHERFMWHITPAAAGSIAAGGYVEPDVHIENPASKRRLRNLIEVTGLMEQLVQIKARPATDVEILRVHTEAYVDRLRNLSEIGWGEAGEFAPVGKDSFPIALLSAGGCIAAADAVMDGLVANAYALVRPPGHHAERDRGRGFCLLANAAITVEHVRRVRGLKRIAMVDWDVHHGNGAQSIYYEDPNVLTISLHQDGIYPVDSGALTENGAGAGIGSCINIPLPPGSGHGAYLAAFSQVVLPALTRFQPDMIIVPCGFDASALDPMARQMAHSETYRSMTRSLKSAANEWCAGRMVMCHEGGYSPTYVPWCGLAVIEELSDLRTDAVDPYQYVASWPGQDLKPAEAEVIIGASALLSRIPAR
jgi:acetoin utilization deacetylase AcuC-like enzyme